MSLDEAWDTIEKALTEEYVQFVNADPLKLTDATTQSEIDAVLAACLTLHVAKSLDLHGRSDWLIHCDARNNPPETIANNELHVDTELRIRPYGQDMRIFRFHLSKERMT